MDNPVQAMDGSGVSKTQVSRRCEAIDERAHAFFKRLIKGNWPYPGIDATCVKTRRAGRIVSGVNGLISRSVCCVACSG